MSKQLGGNHGHPKELDDYIWTQKAYDTYQQLISGNQLTQFWRELISIKDNYPETRNYITYSDVIDTYQSINTDQLYHPDDLDDWSRYIYKCLYTDTMSNNKDNYPSGNNRLLQYFKSMPSTIVYKRRMIEVRGEYEKLFDFHQWIRNNMTKSRHGIPNYESPVGTLLFDIYDTDTGMLLNILHSYDQYIQFTSI